MFNLLTLIQILIGAVGVVDTITWIVSYKWFNDSLRNLQPPTPGDKTPEKALIVTPARNEEENIEAMINSIRLQDYTSYTHVVVDDASSDATPRIIRRMMEKDKRIKYLRIEEDEVPRGWSPKIYAIVRGLEEYDDGSYPVLVFLDADIVLKRRDTLRIMVTRAYTYNAIVSMNPRFKCNTIQCQLMETILTTLAHTLFGFHHVKNPQKKTAWFYGCCWTTTHEIYTKLGGHKAYHNQLVEDKAIAEQAKRQGIEIQVIDGVEYVETTWYPTVGETIEALQRILSPHIAHTTRKRLVLEATLLALHYVQPLITALASTLNPALAPVAIANYLAQTITHYKATRLNKHNPLTSLPTPITGQVVSIALLKSRKHLHWRERTLG